MSGTGKTIVLAFLIMVVLAAVSSVLFSAQLRPETGTGNGGSIRLKTFGSEAELRDFLGTLLEQPQYAGGFGRGMMKAMVAAESSAAAPSDAASDYSTTNIQVEGVDEADFVKNDGKYIYAITGDRLVIVDAYPAEGAEVVSKTELKGNPVEIFVNGDKLVVFERDYEQARQLPGETEPAAPQGMPEKIMIYPYYQTSLTRIAVYDISDRQNPVIAREITLTGDYHSSRMIGDYVYAVVNMAVPYFRPEDPVPLPVIMEGKAATTLNPQDIYYFGYPDYGYSYTNVIALNTQNDNEKYNEKTFLGGNSQNIYVSENNIYLAGTRYSNVVYATAGAAGMVKTAATKVAEGVSSAAAVVGMPIIPPASQTEETVIQKVSISSGNIGYKGKGSVPGHVLNQFSMDEHNGYFRIATTTGQGWGSEPSSNNVYVLDENLNISGKVEDLAPGERIYSARFMGERAYLVTFRKVDPLFVIDLSQPESPKVLGKLKIPGYSDYIHPYDENHIIGIGKEAVAAEEGNFAWYQGIKIALFDVSDPESPREVSKFNIGDRGTDSYALQDHKAFLFSKDRKLLVIPILLAEIDKSRYNSANSGMYNRANPDLYAGEVPTYAYGDYVWQGAYVFSLDAESGFELKGKITHVSESDDSLLKSGYYYNSDSQIRRALYMDNVLYTLSDRLIKMNSLGDLGEVNAVELPQ